jgi:hypothetical protein
MRKHPNSHREATATAPVLDSTLGYTQNARNRNENVPEAHALGGVADLRSCRPQGLQIIPYRPTDGLILASTQSKAIQTLLCRPTQ